MTAIIGRTLLAISFVAVVVVIGLFLAFNRSSSETHPVPKDPAAVNHERVEWLRWNCGLPFPKNTEVVEWDNRSGRDMEAWALLRVRPEQIGSLKSALIKYASAPNRKWVVDDSDTNTVRSVGVGGPDLPMWWKPAELPDPDVIVLHRAGGIFAVFSVKRGLVYFLQWDV